MWAYVDESGCLGMKLGRGSSPFFTVCAVIFADRSQTTLCHSKIEELKSTLRVRKDSSSAKPTTISELASSEKCWSSISTTLAYQSTRPKLLVSTVLFFIMPR
ncbi:DUF3800 domain-containing protein [Aeoliella sp.]|uniref:DUF3800 domain-containing protein n=1 Tax=Aeoliella sp. TaxID=2795800 RepID=UPI003CCB7E6E